MSEGKFLGRENSDHGLNFGLPRGGGRSCLDELDCGNKLLSGGHGRKLHEMARLFQGSTLTRRQSLRFLLVAFKPKFGVSQSLAFTRGVAFSAERLW